jgi:hypothetical protein
MPMSTEFDFFDFDYNTAIPHYSISGQTPEARRDVISSLCTGDFVYFDLSDTKSFNPHNRSIEYAAFSGVVLGLNDHDVYFFGTPLTVGIPENVNYLPQILQREQGMFQSSKARLTNIQRISAVQYVPRDTAGRFIHGDYAFCISEGSYKTVKIIGSHLRTIVSVDMYNNRSLIFGQLEQFTKINDSH